LAADANRVLIIDIPSAMARELGSLGNDRAGSRQRIVGAEADRNGNILAADFQGDQVTVLTSLDNMAAGLFVEVGRVLADKFPLVTVEVQVQDRQRRPMVGLDHRNFVLTESGQAVLEQNFLGAAYLTPGADIAVLIERSPATAPLTGDIRTALRDIGGSVLKVVSVVSAGEQPLREALGAGLSATAQGGGGAAAYSPRWRFDMALRLAATDLLPGNRKRGVVYVGGGALGDQAFDLYSLSEITAYLRNNGVAFYAVLLPGGQGDQAVRYLAEQTGGQVLSLYRPQGIAQALDQLATQPTGAYTLSYRSSLPTDFGKAYMPLEAEVYLLERSGRDNAGYFTPLE